MFSFNSYACFNGFSGPSVIFLNNLIPKKIRTTRINHSIKVSGMNPLPELAALADRSTVLLFAVVLTPLTAPELVALATVAGLVDAVVATVFFTVGLATTVFAPCTEPVVLATGATTCPNTVRVSAFEYPPPGPGLTTVTRNLPGLAKSLANTSIRILVGFTKVVGRSSPLN